MSAELSGSTPPEERLLELLLDRTAEGAGAREGIRRAGGEQARVLAELEGFLARSRAGLGRGPEGFSEGRVADLVARTLERTTREDLGWRGEIGVLLDFVRARLRESRALRVVAASLLLHVFALPVCAWLILRGPRPEPVIYVHLEPSREGPLEADEEETDPPVEIDPGAAHLDGSQDADRIEADLRVSRYLLTVRRGPALPLGADPGPKAPLEIRLLAARMRFLGGADFEPWLEGDGVQRARGASLALLVELYLDRFAVDGVRPAGLTRALDALQRGAEGPGGLADHALERAARYGLWEREHPPGGGRYDPLGRGWIELLRDGLGAGERTHPIARAWLDWTG